MRATETGAEPRLRVVPRTPGPLIDPSGPPAREGDEVDDVVDELLGPSPEGSPGWLDAALLVGGSALVLLALAVVDSSALAVAGAILLLLGSILPLRSAGRALQRRRRDRRGAALLSKGQVLDVSSPL